MKRPFNVLTIPNVLKTLCLGILYLAKDFEQFEAQPEETEQLVVKKIPFEEAYQMVVTGQITDSLTVAGILRVKLLMQGL